MQPQGMPAIALPIDPPPLLRLTSLRCLLFLRFQFSTAYRSSWSSRPIGAPLGSGGKPCIDPIEYWQVPAILKT